MSRVTRRQPPSRQRLRLVGIGVLAAAILISVIAFVKNAFEEEGFTSTGSTNPTAVFANPNQGIPVGGTTYLRQTGSSITRGLIQPRTYGVELQYRF
jgi:iron complex outermembrane receptor protein